MSISEGKYTDKLIFNSVLVQRLYSVEVTQPILVESVDYGWTASTYILLSDIFIPPANEVQGGI